MDLDTFGALVTSVLFVIAAYFYKQAWTPPTPRADETTRRGDVPWRPLSLDVNAKIYVMFNFLIIGHILIEAVLLALMNLGVNLKSIAEYICTSLSGNAHLFENVYPQRSLSPQMSIAISLIIAGGAVRISCHQHLGKMFTWDTSILKDHKLTTDGPYSVVRHPSYSGFILVCIGYILFLFSRGTVFNECVLRSSGGRSLDTIASFYRWSVCVYYTEVCLFILRRSYVEDEMMKSEFGKQWENWYKDVPWRVFPYIL